MGVKRDCLWMQLSAGLENTEGARRWLGGLEEDGGAYTSGAGLACCFAASMNSSLLIRWWVGGCIDLVPSCSRRNP